MAIYKYTLIKYLKSWSTWIITGLTFFLIFFLAGYVAFSNFDPNKINAAEKYSILIVSLVAGITSFLAIFTSVFAGFKSASMFKDEVEDGTFLVMLSKPITRSRLILYKWLALLTMLVLYTFIVSLSFLLTVLVFDKGSQVPYLNFGGINLSTLRSSIVTVCAIMWGILTVVALIFSSIALLLSTKLSVGSTIGIAIALGVIIPITSLVSVFTKKPPYKSISNANASSVGTFLKYIKGLSGSGKKDDIPDPTKDPKTLYQVGLSTGDVDGYRHAFVADLNFQISVLSSYASEISIPSIARDYASQSASAAGVPGLSTGNYVKAKDQGNFIDPVVKTHNELFDALKKQFDDTLVDTWTKSWEARIMLMKASNLALKALVPNSKVPTSFVKIDKLSPFYSAGYPPFDNLIQASKGNNIKLYWNELKSFISSESAKIPDTPTGATSEEIKHHLYLLELMNKIEGGIKDNLTNFTIPKSPDPIIGNIFKNTKGSEFNGLNAKPNVQTILLPIQYLSWLSNPLGALDSYYVNKLFVQTKIPLSSDPKYNPQKIDPSQNFDQKTAAEYLVDHSKIGISQKRYRQIMVLLDNGYNIKRIDYKQYASRNWILITYILIALALVPFSYLMIRKQDYR